jgi:cell division septum initiation protein DivIVA
MGAEVVVAPSADVEHAINRVLAAERAAAEALETCRKEAQAIVEQGRRTARRVLDRADDRSRAVHALADRSLERRLAEIRAESARLSERPLVDDDDLARVRDVVPRLVAELTGGGG